MKLGEHPRYRFVLFHLWLSRLLIAAALGALSYAADTDAHVGWMILAFSGTFLTVGWSMTVEKLFHACRRFGSRILFDERLSVTNYFYESDSVIGMVAYVIACRWKL